MSPWIDFFLFVTCQEVIRFLELDDWGRGAVDEVECGAGQEESEASLRPKPKESARIQFIQSTTLGFGDMYRNQ